VRFLHLGARSVAVVPGSFFKRVAMGQPRTLSARFGNKGINLGCGVMRHINRDAPCLEGAMHDREKFSHETQNDPKMVSSPTQYLYIL
jgi:hypothetical protein